MTTPLLLLGNGIDTSRKLSDVSILDVAPTITKLLGIEPDEDWEGKSLV